MDFARIKFHRPVFSQLPVHSILQLLQKIVKVKFACECESVCGWVHV